MARTILAVCLVSLFTIYGAAHAEEGRPAQADSFFQKGVELHKQGRLDDALAQYDKALKASPKRYEAMFNTGLVYYAQGDFRRAVRSFRNLLDAYPNSAPAQLYVAKSQLKLGQADEAKSTLRDLLSNKKDYLPAMIDLGRAEYQSGNLFSALDIFKRALALQPDNQELATTVKYLEEAGRQEIKMSELEARRRQRNLLDSAIAAEASTPAGSYEGVQRLSKQEALERILGGGGLGDRPTRQSFHGQGQKSRY